MAKKKKSKRQQTIAKPITTGSKLPTAHRGGTKKKRSTAKERRKQHRKINQITQQLLSEGYAVPEIKLTKSLSENLVRALIKRDETVKQSIKAKLPDMDDSALYNFQQHVTYIFSRNLPLLEIIKRWYRETYKRLGHDEMVKGLNETYEKGLWPSWEFVSDSERLVGSLAAMTSAMGLSSGSVADILETAEGFDENQYY